MRTPTVDRRRGLPTRPLPPPARRGAAAPALLFWILAIALFVVPFLSQAYQPTWGEGDPRSQTAWADPNTPFNELDLPFWERVAAIEETVPGLAAHVREQGEAFYGFESEHLRNSGVVEVRRLAAGRKTYDSLCAGCHGGEFAGGVAGDGAGPSAHYMKPRPRNFRKGMFKFASTESGQRPMRKDLYRVVSYGLAGASMPHFKLLTEERRWDVVEYVRYISLRGEFEEQLVTFSADDEELADPEEVAEIADSRWHPDNLRSVFPSTPEPEATAESIERGKGLYLGGKANCAGCHGATGIGDGPSAEAFQDGWGYPIKPRDFTNGVYRAGSENRDLWVTIATGINGSPMGAYREVLSSDEIWDIVHFVRSLEKK